VAVPTSNPAASSANVSPLRTLSTRIAPQGRTLTLSLNFVSPLSHSDLTETLCLDNFLLRHDLDSRPAERTPVMNHQPRYQGSDEDTRADAARKPLTAKQRWTRVAVIAIVAALLLLMLILHITGTVGPGTNG
jgi:hypothetical protein